MPVNFIVSNIIVSVGVFFLLVGSIGLIRLPDFYSRAHAVGKSDTLGIILVVLGLVVHEGFSLNSIKLVMIMVFVGLTGPTATHALAKAAFRFGLRPWFRSDSADGTHEGEDHVDSESVGHEDEMDGGQGLDIEACACLLRDDPDGDDDDEDGGGPACPVKRKEP